MNANSVIVYDLGILYTMFVYKLFTRYPFVVRALGLAAA